MDGAADALIPAPGLPHANEPTAIADAAMITTLFVDLIDALTAIPFAAQPDS